MTIGILTEKPSASRNFADALGGMTGAYNGEQYVIAAARGHLYEFADPSAMVAPALAAQYKSWELEHLPWSPADFTWKRVMKEGAQATVMAIKTALSKCDEIVVATDLDPSGEGDLIFWAIIDELKLHGKRFSRMEFTDESAPSLQKAFMARRPVKSMQSEGAFLMADFRTKFDLLSMQWTRIATKSAGQRAVLRQGRLKSAMLKLVGDQLKAHNEYQKIPFYQNRFRDENGVLYSNAEEPSFKDKNDVPNKYTTSPVVLDSRTNKRTAPPKLLDLAGLSGLLSSKGVKAAMVLSVYQKMYDDQILSYPRTEDRTVTSAQFNDLLPLIDKIAAVVGVDASLLTQRTPRKTHVKDTGAHGANRPGLKVPESLDWLKAKYGPIAPLIYQTLAKNYLAMLAEDYLYERQEGHLEKYPEFKGASNVPKSLGFKAVFDADASDDKDKDEEESTAGLGTSADPFVHEGFPKRPEHPSMKWLMKQLEKRDVGTGATRTSTYAEVTNEKVKFPLLGDTRGKITMAECGEMGYLLLPGTHIGDLGVTEFVQGEMKAVAAGTKTADQALAVVAGWIVEDIKVMQANAVSMKKDLGVTDTVVREKFTGFWRRTGEEVSFNRVWGTNTHWTGHRFTDEECEKLLSGAVVSFDAVSKQKKPYTAVGTLEQGVHEGRSFHAFKPDFDKKVPGASPVPKILCGYTFSADERKRLEAGEKVFIDGLKSGKGKAFAATLYVGTKQGEKNKSVIFDFGKK